MYVCRGGTLTLNLDGKSIKRISMPKLTDNRTSLYFNAGLLYTGPILLTVASSYADAIADSISSPTDTLRPFDVLFRRRIRMCTILPRIDQPVRDAHHVPSESS